LGLEGLNWVCEPTLGWSVTGTRIRIQDLNTDPLEADYTRD
jgi:hypothetical protein